MSMTIALTSGGLQAYLLFLGVMLFIAWSLLLLRYAIFNPDRCQACGYSLAGLESKRCPECGYEPPTDELKADLSRLGKYAKRCALVTIGLLLLGFGFVFIEPRIPMRGEVVFSGRFEPGGGTFEARGSRRMRSGVLSGAAVPEVSRLEVVHGLDRVALVRDPAQGGWVYAESLKAANAADIETRLNLSVSARTIDQVLTHRWDATWPFVTPEVVGSMQAMHQSEHALIDSKNLYNRTFALVNITAASVLTILAAAGVWWVSQRELWSGKV